MNEKAKFVDLKVDATVSLPLITAALKDKFK
jgi:deoxyhypusine synthase